MTKETKPSSCFHHQSTITKIKASVSKFSDNSFFISGKLNPFQNSFGSSQFLTNRALIGKRLQVLRFYSIRGEISFNISNTTHFKLQSWFH